MITIICDTRITTLSTLNSQSFAYLSRNHAEDKLRSDTRRSLYKKNTKLISNLQAYLHGISTGY
jgi:hypothetical protein